MRRAAAVLAIGMLLMAGCGRGDAAAFCAAAEELKLPNGEALVVVLEEGPLTPEQAHDSMLEASALSARMAAAAPDENARRDFEVRAERQRQAAERFGDLTAADEVTPMDLDPETEQAFRRTETYVLQECGVDLRLAP